MTLLTDNNTCDTYNNERYTDRFGQNLGETLREAKKNLLIIAVPNPGEVESVYGSDGLPVISFVWKRRNRDTVQPGTWFYNQSPIKKTIIPVFFV